MTNNIESNEERDLRIALAQSGRYEANHMRAWLNAEDECMPMSALNPLAIRRHDNIGALLDGIGNKARSTEFARR